MRAPVRSYPLRVLGTSISRRYQTASWGALELGATSGQEESSSEGDSPWGTSPAWKCHSPAGRALRVSRVWSLAMAAGERFFCSRTGVKDWARSVVQESRRASGSRRRSMKPRLAKYRASGENREFRRGESLGLTMPGRAGTLSCMKNLRVRSVGVLGLGFSMVGTLLAQNTLAPDAVTGIDAAAADVLKATGVPSASVAVVQGGKIAFVKAYGKARLEPVMLAEPGMQYSIGSVSKQFTAAVILLLMQEGKVKLEGPAAKDLPDLTRANEVTVRQVLSMTSGYQDFWPEDYVMTSMMAPATPQHILDVWGKKPLDFEPGTEWQDSK